MIVCRVNKSKAVACLACVSFVYAISCMLAWLSANDSPSLVYDRAERRFAVRARLNNPRTAQRECHARPFYIRSVRIDYASVPMASWNRLLQLAM